MSGRVVTFGESTAGLGPAVLAIGVFDGVHLGHQMLLRDAVAEAYRLNVTSIALTFDRDPDQVVVPAAAAPQLLTLEDKCRFLLETGVDLVLVVPFTPEVAALQAADFLDQVVAACCSVATVHVGADFRFGAGARGDVTALQTWTAARGARVRPHPLLEVDGAPVTSTRIRRLVTEGSVEEAARLLSRPTRIAGVVHRGREQGRDLGFPTANVVPDEHAALPADGVYAGRAELSDGSSYAAAVSIGVPPTFPEARDYVEAHLIDFDGDLYGEHVTLEFIERLREQRAFETLAELSEAIRTDVGNAAVIGGAPSALPPFELNPMVDIGHKVAHSLGMDLPADADTLPDGSPVVSDPDSLRAAEIAVSEAQATDTYAKSGEEWVELVGRRRLSGLFGDAGYTAAIVTAPLQAAGIPFVWDPYPPEQMPAFRVGYGAVDRPFSLMVPASRLEEARALIDAPSLTRHTKPPTADVLHLPPRTASVPHTPAEPEQPVRTAAPESPLTSESVSRSRWFVRAIIWIMLIALLVTYIASRIG